MIGAPAAIPAAGTELRDFDSNKYVSLPEDRVRPPDLAQNTGSPGFSSDGRKDWVSVFGLDLSERGLQFPPF